MLLHSSVSLFRVFSATMDASSTIMLPVPSSSLTACSYACLVLTPPPKTVKPNALFVPSIMLFAPSCSRLVSLQPIGLRPSPPPHCSLTFSLPRHSISPPLIWSYMGLHPLMSIFVFLGAVAIPTFQPPLPTNSPPAPPCVSFLAIPLITKATAVLTGHPTGLSYPGMLSLMRHPFPSPRIPLVLLPRISSSWTLLTL